MRGEPVTITASENTTVTLTTSPDLYVLSPPALEVKERLEIVGAVVSGGAAIVTEMVFGDPVSVVWALPAGSVMEKLEAAVNVDDTAPPPATAEEVAFTVHKVDEV